MNSDRDEHSLSKLINIIRYSGVLPIRIYEPWSRFEGSSSRVIDHERLWILTNLIEALNEILQGTKASKIRISIDISNGNYAIAMYDKRNNRIYYDFTGIDFPTELLEEIGFSDEEKEDTKSLWESSLENFRKRSRSLIIQPLNGIEIRYISEAIKVIKEFFPQFIIAIGNDRLVPNNFLRKINHSKRYRGDLLLKWLKSLKGEWEFLLALIPDSIYMPGFSTLLTIQDKPAFANVAIISIRNLLHTQDSYMKVIERFRKEIIHIIGHFLGLPDCTNKRCVMSSAETISQLDAKNESFCSRCLARLLPGRYLIIRNRTL